MSSSPSPFVSRFVGVEEAEALDVPDAIIDRSVKLDDLGPVEEMDPEVFETQQQSDKTKEKIVCRFCGVKYNYILRDLHQHKATCPEYNGGAHQVEDDVTVEEDPVVLAEAARRMGELDDNMEVDMEVVGGEMEEEEQAEGEGNGEAVDNDIDNGEENEEDSTQLLESNDACTPPDTSFTPEETNSAIDEDEELRPPDDYRPVLKIARPPADEQGQGDVAKDVDMEAPSDVPVATDTQAQLETPTKSSDATKEALASEESQTGYRLFIDDTGKEQADCEHCRKTCSARPSALATHRKKCRGPVHEAAPLDAMKESKETPTITPKKKQPSKRRASGQDTELRELNEDTNSETGDTGSQTGSTALRRSKRRKTDALAPDTLAIIVAKDKAEETSGEQNRPSTPPTKPSAATTTIGFDSALTHFDLCGTTTRAKTSQCRHCKAGIPFREAAAKEHLAQCDAFKNPTRGSNGASKTPKSQKSTPASAGRASEAPTDVATEDRDVEVISRRPDQLVLSDILAMDARLKREWIFGSAAKAQEAIEHYGRSPYVARAPVARFQAVKHTLSDLNIKELLELSPRSSSIAAVVHSTSVGPRTLRSCVVPMESCDVAYIVYQCGHPLLLSPPKQVAEAFVSQLASDVNCGLLVTNDIHESKLVCGRDRLTLDWQFQHEDNFVICLQGKMMWKVARSAVTSPCADYPSTFETALQAEDCVKLHLSTLGAGGEASALNPPSNSIIVNAEDDDEDMESTKSTAPASHTDDKKEQAGQQWVVDAGSVLYLPAGTWYSATTVDLGVVLLQITLKKVTYGDIAVETLRQFVTSEEEWQAPVGAGYGSKSRSQRQQHLQAMFLKLWKSMEELSPSGEILPDLMLSMEECGVPATILHEPGSACVTRYYEFDLTVRHGFKGGKHFQFLKGSMFRVNPLAVLLSVEELPDAAKPQGGNGTELAAYQSPQSKKALNRKNKRAQKVDQRAYLLHVGFGNQEHRSRLRVKFLCTNVQQTLVDWIRLRDTRDPLHVSELAKVMTHGHGAADEDVLKTMLRFLCMTGYLVEVKVPL